MKRIIVVILALLLVISIWQVNLKIVEASLNKVDLKNTTPSGLIVFWDTNKEDFNLEFDIELEKCNPETKYALQRYEVVVSNPEVSKISWEVSRSGKNELEKTYLLYDYIAKNFNYKVFKNWRNTTEILKSKEGDCADQSILLVSMLKNIGIDAYVLQGDVDKSDHAWVVAKVDGHWIQLDPTAKDFWAVQKCLKNENCPERELYTSIEGMFNDGVSLKCSS